MHKQDQENCTSNYKGVFSPFLNITEQKTHQ